MLLCLLLLLLLLLLPAGAHHSPRLGDADHPVITIASIKQDLQE
jgi:hypothetical protein